MRNFIYFLIISLYSNAMYGSYQYTISNYNKKEYGADNQNWQIIQHNNGWIYVANNKGLLEFDGVYWNTYPFEFRKMRAVQLNKDKRIYGGGIEQFGYFTPNELGKMDYTSLSDLLPKNTEIGVIWEIYIIEDDVYFMSNHTIFRWKNEQLSTISENRNIFSSAVIDDKLYFVCNEGLTRWDDPEFTLLPNTSFLSNIKTVTILPTPRGILFVSSRDGLFFYDEGNITPYTGVATDFIKNNQIFCATYKENKLVLGSVQNGVLIINLEEDKAEHISIENGLQNKTVLRVYFDRDNNLWVGLDNGIDCIHLNSPVLSLCKSKIIGTGYSSHFTNGYLYLGTNQGLYYAETDSIYKEKDLDIKMLQGIEGQVWSIREIHGEVYCNSDNGVFILDKDKAHKINGTWGAWNIMPSNEDKNKLIIGTYSGLYLLERENGKWSHPHEIHGFRQSSKNMMGEDMQNWMWVSNSNQGLYRLKISDDLRSVESVKNYNDENFPLKGDVYIARVNNNIVFASTFGLFRYNNLKDSLEEYKELEDLMEGKTQYSYIKQDPNNNIWYISNNVVRILRYNAKEKKYIKNYDEAFLTHATIENFEDLYFYSDKEVLVGTEDGFSYIRFDEYHKQNNLLNLQIRKVYSSNYQDSLIYGQSFIQNKKKLSLPYSLNSIRIEYNACIFEPLKNVLFSYRLLGSNKEEWSDYNKHTIKEFTHLREGNYKFEVKAMTNNQESPIVASLAFTIRPPWHRSIFAYMLYITGILLVIYIIWHRVQESKKILILQKKQEILQQRLEFKQQAELKDQKIDSLKKEKLEAELSHRTKELLSSTVNVIRKNEILQDIKKIAVSMAQSIHEENLINIRRKNLQLINKIDLNIEHDNDFQVFLDGYDMLNHNFTKTLDKKYPGLSNKEKILCTYIHMNMISKEIAPLMNMSVRGIEVIRYRLRKKLNINEKDSLYEFLHKLTAEHPETDTSDPTV